MQLMEMIEANILNEDNTWHIDDLDLHSDECGVDVHLFWHDPSFNLNWYPIIQIDNDDGDIVKWKEGPENSSMWMSWIDEMLEEYSDVDDWQNMR